MAPNQKQTTILRAALKNLLEADRDFLGDDNVCVYCGLAQHVEGHALNCVITQAENALKATNDDVGLTP